MASTHCNPAIFRFLVPRAQSTIHQADGRGETTLVRIVRSLSSSRSRYEAARILLPNVKADRTTHNVNGLQRALQLAVQVGDAEMCRPLICEGRLNAMSALKHDHDGRLVTKDKPCANEEVILQLL
jgi:hypothetical protein